MSKIYALFKQENEALTAIDKIEQIDKDIKITLFDKNSLSVEENTFINDADIIGSPTSMVYSTTAQRTNENLGYSYQPEFFPFCTADFVYTCDNSLNEPAGKSARLPCDGYSFGIALTASGVKKKHLNRILKDSGANII